MKGHMEKDGFHPHTQYKGVRKSRDQQVITQGVKLPTIRKARTTIKGKKGEIYGIRNLDQARADNEKIANKEKIYDSKIKSFSPKIEELDRVHREKVGKLEKDEYDLKEEFSKWLGQNQRWHYIESTKPAEQDLASRITAVANFVDYDKFQRSGQVYLVNGKWIKATTYLRSDSEGRPTDEEYVKSEEVTVK